MGSPIGAAYTELRSPLTSALQIGSNHPEDTIARASGSTTDRWGRELTEHAQNDETIAAGRRISNHVRRHSYARHLLTSGIPINYLSR